MLERCQKPSGGVLNGEKMCSISIHTVTFEGPKQLGVTGSSQRLAGRRHPKAHKEGGPLNGSSVSGGGPTGERMFEERG